jgi:hypothetical protein
MRSPSARCRCNRAIAFDLADALASTSRFVVVDAYEISGGGIVREALPDKQDAVRKKVLLREWKWEVGSEMIASRDKLAAEWNLNLIYDENRQALDEKRTFPDGAVSHLTCCGFLKTEALTKRLSASGRATGSIRRSAPMNATRTPSRSPA